MVNFPCRTCLIFPICKQKRNLSKLISECPLLDKVIKTCDTSFRQRIILARSLIKLYKVEDRYMGILTGEKIQDTYKSRSMELKNDYSL
jgi:hypothetical protein